MQLCELLLCLEQAKQLLDNTLRVFQAIDKWRLNVGSELWCWAQAEHVLSRFSSLELECFNGECSLHAACF
ncbi:MAG TPA: hypothetical protein DEF45_19870 [Rhodopirellula sp.]|nr:MAG: hypothetical protein CBD74_01780 [Saprospirales bacterium TMED214]HBV65272.1 hypothetical protein [Rhodopirellula sp.]